MSGILRLRVGVPGHGRKCARLLGLPTVSQTGKFKFRDVDPNEVAGKIYPNWLLTNAILNPPILLNYGVCHETPFTRDWLARGYTILNPPGVIAACSCKLDTLRILSGAGVAVPDWTTDIEQAKRWIAEGSRVFCRTLTRAKKGKGIVIAKTVGELVTAPLYTREFAKTHEYRVHAAKFNGVYELIDWTQKKSCERLAKDGLNADVRNRGHGWLFSHHSRLGHDRIRQIGLDAIKAMGMDYGGVDIGAIWAPKVAGKKRKLLDVRVFETNSAPGMRAPATLDAYISAFRRMLGEAR